MKIEAMLSLGVPLIYLSLLAIERRVAARPYVTIDRWPLLGGLFFVITLVIGAITPHLLPLGYLQSHTLLDLSRLGLWGIPFGILAATFFGYWLHRAKHHFDLLWRAIHQLHHSPNRVDILGAFYAHPLEVVVNVTVGTLVATFVLGLTPVAASAVGLVTASMSMFQHWNIHTPRILGYFLQRPESHCLHHERNVHGRNFSDLPLWDIVFGTFENPASAFTGEVGFNQAASSRVSDMLLMRDAHQAGKTAAA
jgi:sterol desaturase/sphingolipid hydroxylase (fatty acid hydroxylase superfamily)